MVRNLDLMQVQVFLLIQSTMKLITTEGFELKVAPEALLVKPIRKLWNQDRSKGKEAFYMQMSVLFFVYSPASNYSYIEDEKERLEEVCKQEGITHFKMSAEFKQAVEVFKKLNTTPEAQLLEDCYTFISKSRKILRDIDYNSIEDPKEQVNTMKIGMGIVSMVPKLVKDLSAARKAVEKELDEEVNARGSQELTIGDIGLD